MRSIGTRSRCPLVICGVILSLGLACTGCSPKDGAQQKELMSSSAVSFEETKAPHQQEIERLRQENDKLRKTVAEVQSLQTEITKLQEENKELRQAASTVSTLKKELERLQRENVALQKAVASARAAPGRRGDAPADTTQTRGLPDEGYRKYADQSQKRAAALLAQYDSARNVKEKITFLESLSEWASRQDPSVIRVVRKAVTDPNSQVARAALDLLADYPTPEILPAVERALQLADEQARVTAAELLAAVSDPQVIPLFLQALGDKSAQVRAAALAALQEQDSDPIKLTLLEKTIASPFDDVKYEVASMLGDRSDHPAVELLIEGLKDPDPQFRAEVSERLDFLIDQKFSTYREAQAWWTKNKNRYDDELIRIDE